MLRKKILVGLALAVFLTSMVSTVFASGTSFNVVVPKLGGATYTPVTRKTLWTNQYATFSQLQVGANKTLRFAAVAPGIVTPIKTGTTGSNITLPYNQSFPTQWQIQGQIGTNLSDVVNIQAWGYFNSN